MRCRTWLLALALSLCAPGRVLAQPAAPSQADADFRKGREARERGDYELALALFRKSQDLEPGRGKELNIAICEEQLGLLATAMQHFQQLLPDFDDDPHRAAVVKDYIAKIDPRLPHLQINLDLGGSPSAGVTVTYDDAPLAPALLGAEMPADPGKHVITVNATERRPRRYEVTIEEGKRTAITVEPGAVIPPEVKPLADSQPVIGPRRDIPLPVDGKRVGGFIVGGVGLVGLGIGGVTGIIAIVVHNSAESRCPSHHGCDQDVINQASRGKALSVASTVAFAAGAVGVGVGLYLVLSGGKPAAAPTVGVTLLPDGAGVRLRREF